MEHKEFINEFRALIIRYMDCVLPQKLPQIEPGHIVRLPEGHKVLSAKNPDISNDIMQITKLLRALREYRG